MPEPSTGWGIRRWDLVVLQEDGLKMRLRTLVALLAAVLLALPAAAQQQRGSIEGVVRDSSGAILPGVTVTVTGGAGVKLDAVSSSDGSYRFPSLLPGTYTVSANLQGFGPGKVSDVQIALEQVKKVDFALALAGVSETVQVTAESPLVDVKQTQRQTNIRAEQVNLLPHNRDFTSLVTQAPGANNEPKSGGITIDGAAAAENRYIVDGIETTDLVHGQSGKNVLADFIEDVEVKSSGYPAEYGGSTGGVINVLTKSGTNDFHGNALTYFQGDRFTGQNNQTLRLGLANANQSEFIRFPEDENKRVEPGGALGGPVFKNKAWFFGAYQPAMISTTRNVTAASSGNPNANPSTTTQKEQIQYATANQTTQFSSKLRTRVAFNNSWDQRKGQLASTAGTDSPTTNYTKGSTFPNWSLSGNADYSLSSRFVISARLGRFVQDQHDFNVPDVPLITFSGSNNLSIPGVPANLQHGTGFTNVPSNNAITRDTLTRNYAQIDGTYYAHAGGEHQIKGGVQLDHRGEDINSGALENAVNLHWGQSFNGQTGAFGYYELRSNAVSPRQGIITVGNVHSNLTGIFIQDQWAVSNKLTVNGGVRTENENVPAYTNADGVAPNPIKFSMADKIAPRAGFAYDLKGDGRTKLYGSWGVFYDIFKLELPQGSFGGQKWISYFYTLDTPDYNTLRDNPACPPACSGTQIGNPIDFRAVSVTPGLDVETNLKPMRSQEMSFGMEHQLTGVTAVTARYIHKQLDRAIDDVGDLDAAGNEAYIIANPGFGLVDSFDISSGSSLFAPQGATNLSITMPKAKRTYNAMELGYEKRLSNRWFFKSTYTLSRLSGNYSGLSQSDENGRSDPNVGRDFDYPAELFNGSGQPEYGVLATDRTHQLKLNAIYQLPWGTTVGANEYLASGVPITSVVPIITGHGYPVNFAGRGDLGRTPTYSQTDLFVQHSIRLGGRAIQLEATVLNLFNRRTATNINSSIARAGAIPLSRTGAANNYNEAAFYAGQLDFNQLIAASKASGAITPDPRFGLANAFEAPIQARFGVKFIF